MISNEIGGNNPLFKKKKIDISLPLKKWNQIKKYIKNNNITKILLKGFAWR